MLHENASPNERGRVHCEPRHSGADQTSFCDSRDNERAALARIPNGPEYVRLRLAHATRVRPACVSCRWRSSLKRASSA